jgi:hypothetical protein
VAARLASLNMFLRRGKSAAAAATTDDAKERDSAATLDAKEKNLELESLAPKEAKSASFTAPPVRLYGSLGMKADKPLFPIFNPNKFDLPKLPEFYKDISEFAILCPKDDNELRELLSKNYPTSQPFFILLCIKDTITFKNKNIKMTIPMHSFQIDNEDLLINQLTEILNNHFLHNHKQASLWTPAMDSALLNYVESMGTDNDDYYRAKLASAIGR